MYDQSPFASLGRYVYRNRKLIIALWIVATLVLEVVGSRLPDVLGGSGFRIEGSPSSQVEKALKEEFGVANSSMILVFESERYNPEDAAFRTFVDETLTELSNVSNVVSTESPYESPNRVKGNLAYATLGFDKEYDKLREEITAVKNKLSEHEDITVRLTGVPVITEDMNEASQKELAKAEAIGLPAALVVLLLAFGGLVAAAIPIVIGALAVLCAMGILYFIGSVSDLSIFVLNVVPMIGFALGIDFALLLVNRFREELINFNKDEAIVRAVATAGRSIAFSGLCVLLGLAGMLVINVEIFRTVAISGIIVVVISVISALTFLPSLLALLGHRVNALKLFKPKHNKKSGWHIFSSFVMRRPGILALATIVVLSLGLIPVMNLNLAIPESDSLPASYDSRIAFEKLEETFGEKRLNPVQVVVTARENMMNSNQLEKLEALVTKLKDEEIVDDIQSIFSLTGTSATQLSDLYGNDQTRGTVAPVIERLVSGDKTLLTVTLNVNTSSEKAQDWVRKWQGEHGDLEMMIGGKTKFYQEIFDELYAKAPYGFLIVIVSTYIILFLAFRSVLIPFKAIIMNVLSLGATFGILVWIFQEGHLSGLLDFVPNGTIGLMIPIFIFSLVFGLSMDYEVFLISRMHEVYLETKDNDEATLKGLISTSKIITSAAAIMIVITGSFAFTGVMPVKQMGVGIALAIFLDATLIRMVLTPALMKLLGHLNWWSPKILRKKATD